MRSRAVFERNVLSECQDGEWYWGKSHTSHVLRVCVIRDDPLFSGFAPSKMQFHRKKTTVLQFIEKRAPGDEPRSTPITEFS